MSPNPTRRLLQRLHSWLLGHVQRGTVPAGALTIVLAGVIGILAGLGAIVFSSLIDVVSESTVLPIIHRSVENRWWLAVLWMVPALGLLAVAWFTRRFAPEAQGHGVPEVITAVARHDGVIRPRVSLVKILASGVCIGTGGSVGREGPIVQIGSALGSAAGQMFKLSGRNIKVLVASGAAAGISATFNAPLAGVMFASEIILGNFAVESLTPIVIASVLANVVQLHIGEYGLHAAFQHLDYAYQGAWDELPSYILLGLLCGLAALSFTKLLYAVEDAALKFFPKWWVRALVLGSLVGLAGVAYQSTPPVQTQSEQFGNEPAKERLPPLFGVGYSVVEHALHLENELKPPVDETGQPRDGQDKIVSLNRTRMIQELWWLLPLAFLKPLATSITLGGGGSGGIFAPSLFLGATLGASFGLIVNLLVPGWSANPGVYAIVGMGAVVAGTTHGVLSAILIVYEMTDNPHIILPIMIAAGLASVLSRFIDPESIYEKKLSRRGESIARGQDMHWLEHVMVRDVMIRKFPTVRYTDNVTAIIKIARANSHIESIPVMGADNRLVGIIRPEDLHRVLDSDISPHLINAEDIALTAPIAVSPDANLLEALRDFGTRDVETLPVQTEHNGERQLVGLLLRTDVMRRYREEMLSHR